MLRPYNSRVASFIYEEVIFTEAILSITNFDQHFSFGSGIFHPV